MSKYSSNKFNILSFIHQASSIFREFLRYLREYLMKRRFELDREKFAETYFSDLIIVDSLFYNRIQ